MNQHNILSKVLCLILFHLSYSTVTAQDGQPGCTDGDVRLVGGPNEFEGRVEICFDEQWGKVCGRSWLREDGEVVCRQLGYIFNNDTLQQGKADATAGGKYGNGNIPTTVGNFLCDGTETRLDSCSYTRLNTSDECFSGTDFDAQVVCTDPRCFDSPQSVILVGGNTTNEGRVEICTEDGFRAALCDQSWDERSAQTLCRGLGLLQNGDAVPVYGNFTAQYSKYINVSCNGSEQSLSACQSESATSSECSPAGVECPGMFPTTTNVLDTTPNFTVKGNDTNDFTTSDTSTGILPTTEPSTTTENGGDLPSKPLLSDTVVIILGIVGGLILLLLIGIMVLLFVLVITLRKQKKPSHYLQNLNGSEVHKDTEKTVINDLYTMNSDTELSKVSDPRPYSTSPLSEEIQPYECAELEDIRNRARTGTFTSRRELTPTNTSVASTPAVLSPVTNNVTSNSVPSILRELTPVIPTDTNSDSHVYALPSSTSGAAVTDAQGYASLESPNSTSTSTYDAIKDMKKANPNLYVQQPTPSVSQYETPESSQYQTPEPDSHYQTPELNSQYQSPEPYQTPVYDKLVEPSPLLLVTNGKLQEHDEVKNSEQCHAGTPKYNNQELEYDVSRGSDETHEYDVPPLESPQPVDIMELGNNDQNPYAVLEQNVV